MGSRQQRRAGIAAVFTLFIAGAAGLLLKGVIAGASKRERPNIVVIQTDDQTVESLRAMPRTQRLLFDGGTSFANQTVAWPSCGPSRATFFSGQYAHNHGMQSNNPPRGGIRRFDDSRTLATALDDRGYFTAHVGKYLNGYGEETEPEYVPPGWDEWFSAVGPTVQSDYRYEMNDDGQTVEYGARERHYKQDVLTRRAVDVIESEAGRDPLYLQLDYTAPHTSGSARSPQPPFDCRRAALPPPRYANAFSDAEPPSDKASEPREGSTKPRQIRERPPLDGSARERIDRRYRCGLAALRSVDDGVGRVFDALERAGEAGDTYVIFTSDNGYIYGEHRIETGKDVVYDPSTNVPLAIAGPGIEPGAVRDTPTSNVDLAPTIASLAGAELETVPDGEDLGDLIAGEEDFDRSVLIERTDGKPESNYQAIRTRRYVYVEYENGDVELYDMLSDRRQPRSLHRDPDQRARVAELSQRLDRLRDCAGTECATG
ncbi:sulfatase [Thermoleophilia bacterium SCSIO 60948]|nr:sulfatase [Thermoleophilia bacterium SCSIO 60948]